MDSSHEHGKHDSIWRQKRAVSLDELTFSTSNMANFWIHVMKTLFSQYFAFLHMMQNKMKFSSSDLFFLIPGHNTENST